MHCEYLASYWSGNYCVTASLNAIWDFHVIVQLCCTSRSLSWYHEQKISIAPCCCVSGAVSSTYTRPHTSWGAVLGTLGFQGLFCSLKPAMSISFFCTSTLAWAGSTEQWTPLVFSAVTLACYELQVSFGRLHKKWRWTGFCILQKMVFPMEQNLPLCGIWSPMGTWRKGLILPETQASDVSDSQPFHNILVCL